MAVIKTSTYLPISGTECAPQARGTPHTPVDDSQDTKTREYDAAESKDKPTNETVLGAPFAASCTVADLSKPRAPYQEQRTASRYWIGY
jgi:hypothetical protein